MVRLINVNQRLEEEKRALELTYFDTADIYRNTELEDGGITKKQRQKVLENIECSLSKKYTISARLDSTNNLEGEYVLFSSQEILKGDEIHLTTLNGRKYKLLAGMPHDLLSHFETPVTVKERA